MRIVSIVLVSLLSMAAACASAKPPAVKAGPASYVDRVQQKKETDQQFLLRSAMFARDYTGKTGYEICGVIYAGPRGHWVDLFTTHSQVTCSFVRTVGAQVDRNDPLNEQTLHTHPPEAMVGLNEEDVRMINQKRRLFKKKVGTTMRFSPRQFSEEDYASGHGYMVHVNEVWQQQGKGTARLVFTLPPQELNAAPTQAPGRVEN